MQYDLPELDVHYVKKTVTPSGVEVFQTDDVPGIEDIIRRVDSAYAFVSNFLKKEGICYVEVPYRVYVYKRPEELNEIAKANGKNDTPYGVRATVIKNQLVTGNIGLDEYIQRARETCNALGLNIVSPENMQLYLTDYNAHECTHPPMRINREEINGIKTEMPLWLLEGFPIYAGAQTRGRNLVHEARAYNGEIPPVSLLSMNIKGPHAMYEFGHIRLQSIDQHPGHLAAGSFIQYLVDEGIYSVKEIWHLITESENPNREIGLLNLEKGWLDYIGREQFEGDTFAMDVVKDIADGKAVREQIVFERMQAPF